MNIIDIILDVLNEVQAQMGMGAGGFYISLILLLIPVLTFLLGIINSIWHRSQNKLFYYQRKEENSYFYVIIMFIEMFIVLFELVVCMVIFGIINQLLINLNIILSDTAQFTISFLMITIFGFISSFLISKLKIIRKRCLGMGKLIFLIYMPLFISQAMIIIDKKDEQIKIRFDCIIRVEYGGEPMIVLTENPFLLRK